MHKPLASPLRLFAALCALSIAGLGAYLYWAKTRAPATAHLQQQPAPSIAADATADGGGQQIFFRYTGVDGNYGKLAVTQRGQREAVRFVNTLACEVAYVAAGRGICLTANRGVVTTYAAKLFDAQTFAVLATFPLSGIPSRARVSADGKLAAFTVFVSGHSYASADFSTQTMLVDVASGRPFADVEDFAVFRDGRRIKEKDFNFWGVTFTPDAKHFYATLSTRGQHLLVRADIAQRSATVIHENVECPSVSPDGTKVAYKKRFSVNGRLVWRLHVLDLATRAETALSEERSIDDQLEWLNEVQLLYSAPDPEAFSAAATSIWRIAANGKEPPALFLRSAYSPSAVRSL